MSQMCSKNSHAVIVAPADRNASLLDKRIRDAVGIGVGAAPVEIVRRQSAIRFAQLGEICEESQCYLTCLENIFLMVTTANHIVIDHVIITLKSSKELSLALQVETPPW